MTIKAPRISYLLVSILLILFLLASSCSHKNSDLILTIDDTKLYLKDFLYDIYETESDGNQLESFYQTNMGYSYWDYKYDGTTMRELAKNSVMASVVMHEILASEATLNKISLTKKEKASIRDQVDTILASFSKEEAKKSGLTYDVLYADLSKSKLGDKFKAFLIKDIEVDRESITATINRDDYESEEDYKDAVDEAIQAVKDKQFTSVYNKIKSKYNIVINFDYWDNVTIGNLTPQTNAEK